MYVKAKQKKQDSLLDFDYYNFTVIRFRRGKLQWAMHCGCREIQSCNRPVDRYPTT